MDFTCLEERFTLEMYQFKNLASNCARQHKYAVSAYLLSATVIRVLFS